MLSFPEEENDNLTNLPSTANNVNFQAPVQTFTLRERMINILDVPEKATSLILDSYYLTPNQVKIPLMAIYPYEVNGDEFVLDHYEIIQLIHDYEHFFKYYPDEALQKFEDHVNNLVLNKSYKYSKNLLITSDAVFQSPMLDGPRKEETLKRALANRRRMAVKGKCVRKGCTSDRIYKEERILRSGDEASVWIKVCSVCNYNWKT